MLTTCPKVVTQLCPKDLNPRPVDRKSNALTVALHATCLEVTTENSQNCAVLCTAVVHNNTHKCEQF